MTPPEDTTEDTPPVPEQTAPAAAAAQAADVEAQAGGDADDQADAARAAAKRAGLTESDADVLIDRMEARGLFDRPTPPAATATAAAEQPAGDPVEVPPEPPRKLTFAERFRGKR